MEQRKSFDSNGVQFVWDSTSINLASECLRKYYYRMIANLVPRSTSVHLLFGGIYASALEQFYHLRAEGAGIDEALNSVVHRALIDSWDHERDEDGQRIVNTGQAVHFHDPYNRKSRMNLIRSIIWYVDQFGDEESSGITTHHLSDGKPAVELSFVLEFDDDVMLAGHLDRVIEFGGHLYWMDQKTTSSALGPRYYESFKPSMQFMLYTWAGQMVLHSPVKGGVIDAAQILVGSTKFDRQFISFTAEQLEEWAESASYHIARAREATAEAKWPMNMSACGNYGGCPYRSLCARPASVRDHFAEADFVHPAQPWDPATPR